MNAPTLARCSIGCIEALVERFGDRLSTRIPDREQHAEGLRGLSNSIPDAVLFVESSSDVADAVKICGDSGCPIIGYGAGTSVEGHVHAVQGGVVIDFSRMNKILEISVDDFDCRVQPGVTREQLNTELRDKGLFFSVDPGANATIGGMAATGASGTTTVRYGSMMHNVLGLETVLADGRIVRTGGRARKSSAGYNLTKLLVGSEGTLCLFTELTLRLHPIPRAIKVATCAFPTVKQAVDTAIQIIQFGLGVARIELLDRQTILAVNAYSKLDLEPGDYLFLEFHGGSAGVDEDAATAEEIALEHEGSAFQAATTAEGISRLWRARHLAGLAGLAMVPNSRPLTTDIAVPLSELSNLIAETQKRIDASGLYAVLAGHVGDGSFHVGFVLPKNDEQALAEAEDIHRWLVRRAIELGGTCTGEHGIGLGKQDYLLSEHGDGVAVMRSIKASLDPRNILNPGKVFQFDGSDVTPMLSEAAA